MGFHYHCADVRGAVDDCESTNQGRLAGAWWERRQCGFAEGERLHAARLLGLA